jgi:hypothetical protein
MTAMRKLPFAHKQMKIKAIAIAASVVLAASNLVKVLVKDNDLGLLYAMGVVIFTATTILFVLDWRKSKRQGVVCVDRDEIVFHRGPILTLAYPQSALTSVAREASHLAFALRVGAGTVTRRIPFRLLDVTQVDAFVRDVLPR